MGSKHQDMPQIQFSAEEVAAILAYLGSITHRSLETAARARSQGDTALSIMSESLSRSDVRIVVARVDALGAVPIVILAATEGPNRHQNRGDLHGGRGGIGNRSRHDHDSAWRISMVPIVTVPIVHLLDHCGSQVSGDSGRQGARGGLVGRDGRDRNTDHKENKNVTHRTSVPSFFLVS
jgi:hypothetical protein